MRKAMNRDVYLQRAHEFAPRGADLPQTKLTEADVLAIRDAQEKRADLREHIREHLDDNALAKRFGVHVRTIQRVTNYINWRQAGVTPVDDIGRFSRMPAP